MTLIACECAYVCFVQFLWHSSLGEEGEIKGQLKANDPENKFSWTGRAVTLISIPESPQSLFPLTRSLAMQLFFFLFYLRKFPLGICCHWTVLFSLQTQTSLKVTLCARHSCTEAIHLQADFHSSELGASDYSHFSTWKLILYMGETHPKEILLEIFTLWSITINAAQKSFKKDT